MKEQTMLDQPSDLLALMRRSRAARARIAAHPDLPDEAKMLFEAQYAPARADRDAAALGGGLRVRDADRLQHPAGAATAGPSSQANVVHGVVIKLLCRGPVFRAEILSGPPVPFCRARVGVAGRRLHLMERGAAEGDIAGAHGRRGPCRPGRPAGTHRRSNGGGSAGCSACSTLRPPRQLKELPTIAGPGAPAPAGPESPPESSPELPCAARRPPPQDRAIW